MRCNLMVLAAIMAATTSTAFAQSVVPTGYMPAGQPVVAEVTAPEPSPTIPDEQSPWQFTIAPYLWMLNLNGSTTVEGQPSDLDVQFRDILSHLDIAAMVEGEVRYDRFGVFTNYIYGDLTAGETFYKSFRPSVQAATGQPGIGFKVNAGVQLNVVSVGAFYRIGEYALGKPPPRLAGPGPSVAIEPYVGARYTSIVAKIDFIEGPTFKGTESWWDPIVGVRSHWTYDDHWNGLVLFDVGGFGVGSDFSWRVFGGIGYRFGLFEQRDANLIVGYKALGQDFRSGSGSTAFEWDTLYHGPVVGLAISF